MNIQFTNWQAIHLQDFSNNFNGQYSGIQANLTEVDSVLNGLSTQYISIYDGDNSVGYGMWGSYQLTVRGSGFMTSANPAATSVSLVDPLRTYSFIGAINITNDFAGFYGITGGVFTSITTLYKDPTIPSSNYSYSIKGNFVYSDLGRIDGGTITSVTTSNNRFRLKGNLTIDANEVITGGIINEISYNSPTGESFAVSNVSIPYLTFIGLIPNNPLSIDFAPIINYLTSSTNLAGNDIIVANANDTQNDTINGYAGNDTLGGGGGDDELTGGAGVDKLTGGKGNDTYNIDLVRTSALATSTVALQDTVTELANPLIEGIDTIILTNLTGNAGAPIDTSNITNATTLIVNANVENFDASQTGNIKLNITGNALANTITGNDADNILDGSLGKDTLDGGAGNDTYLVDATFTGTSNTFMATLQDTVDDTGGGLDTLKLRGAYAGAVTQTLRVTDYTVSNIEGLDISLTGISKINLEGNESNNTLIGNAAANILTGGLGNDTLDGGIGADTLNGGDGNDKYVIDNLLDVIIDSSGDDTAEIKLTTGTYTLSPTSDIENVILAGVAAINATGNAGNNSLTGNAAANILNGGGGTDTLTGGDGSDTYIIDGNDTVIETNALAAGGIDLVKSSVSYTLTDNVENLTLTNNINANGGNDPINGTGNALNNIITGNAGDNVLDGAAGNDTLIGGDGDDELTGGAGVDKLTGGKGNDTYNIDLVRTSALATSTVALQDTVTELANPLIEGVDTIILTNSTGNAGAPIDTSNITNATTLIVNANVENFDASQTGNIKLNITGNALANEITGNDADNILDGGLGIDTLDGGAGNDTYLVDATFTGTSNTFMATLQDTVDDTGGGLDTLKLRGAYAGAVTQTLRVTDYTVSNIEGLDISLTGISKINLEGNESNNTLIGNAAANILTGGLGNDTLDGGIGADTLNGGDGNDKYVIDNLLDVIIDSSGDDTAEIKLTTGTYTLSPTSDIENVILAGVAAINATGNAGNNSLTGNAAANILNGGGGTDTLTGGDGNDTYIIDGDDTVIEGNSGGTDTVISSVDFDLSTNGSNIENLTFIGTDAFYAKGNELKNIITGNSANNLLEGGANADTLIGGAGSDTYLVELAQTGTTVASHRVTLEDTVTELAGGGVDTIELRNSGNFNPINASTITLGANIENLSAQAISVKLNINGNSLNNTIYGSQADNIIMGLDGDDTIYAVNGNDTLLGGNGIDTLVGSNGDDYLDGGAGADILYGDSGNDTYILDLKVTGTGAAATVAIFDDSISDSTDAGVDTIKLRGNATLTNATMLELAGGWGGIEILDASATGSTKLNLTGNAENNILTGNAAANILTGGLGNDTLDGGIGADTLNGGDGNDKYVIDNLLDVIIDSSGDDTAEIKLTTGTYTLSPTSDIENVILAGVAAINATGNAGNNSLTGNAAANILNGGGGTDTLTGGDGSDTYIIDGNDTVIETNALAAGGIDLVKSSVSYTLTDNVENLTLTNNINANGGNDPINGTGNALNNIITGNAGDNVLDGAAGNDTLIGGDGDDELTGGAGVDKLTGGKGNDTYNIDLVRTSALATSTVALQDTVTELANPLIEGVDTIILTNSTGNAGAPIDTSNITNATTLIVNANVENFDASQTGNIKLNITGNALANTITGNDADNILNGGAGSDTLDGGLGSDIFKLDILENANFDTILDFNQGEDKIQLQGNAFLSKIPKGLFSEMFVSGSSASALDNNDFLIYDTSTASLYFDSDAVGINQAVKIAQFNIGQNISFNDFTNATTNPGEVIYGPTNLYLNINLYGGNGDDLIYGRDITGDYIFAGSGNDIIYAAQGATYYSGNHFYGEDGSDYLIGGDGYDVLDGGLGNDILDGGAGDKDVAQYTFNKGGVNIDLRITGPQNTGTSGYDTLINIERIHGSQGPYRDRLIGNDNDNNIDGNGGLDYISGQGGNDTISFGYGSCTILGDAGDDLLVISAGNNDSHIINGGAGYDTLNFGPTGFSVKLDLSLTTSQFTSLSGINGSGAYVKLTSIENLYGSRENDSLKGNADNNTIDGSYGNDVLTGGIGADVFKWGFGDRKNSFDTGSNRDTVTDFSTSENDVLDLRDLLDGENSSNLFDYLDIITNSGKTEIRISSEGNFTNGNYSAGSENTHITLTGVNLFTATGSSTEAELIQNLITNNKLIVDA